jgi:hypothetical protein
MQLFNFHVTTKQGFADGSIEAKNEDSARNKLAGLYEGELQDADGNPTNNNIESIELEKVEVA